MVADAYADALEIFVEHRKELERLTGRLLEQTELERVDILSALGDSSRLTRRTPRPSPRPVPVLAASSLGSSGPRDRAPDATTG